MAWSTIRPATDADIDALNETAKRFAHRHNLARAIAPWISDNHGWYDQVEAYLQAHATGSNHLWRRCVRRALNEPNADGIAWGSVCRHVK